MKETDQAFIGGSSPRVQESASCIADDDGSAQWDNFQVIEGGIAFLFIQEPGADNRALMILEVDYKSLLQSTAGCFTV